MDIYIMIFEDDHLVNYELTDSENGGYELLDSNKYILFSSFGKQRSLVETAKYLTSFKNIVDIYSNNISDEVYVNFLKNNLNELSKKLQDRKIFKLYDSIELFSKKYCISNDYDTNYGDEWIEIFIDSDYILKLDVEKISSFSKNTADFFNLKYGIYNFKSNNDLEIPSDFFPIFYGSSYNSFESIFTSYDSESLLFKSLILCINIDGLDGNSPYYDKCLFYSVYFFKIKEVNEILINHFNIYNYFEDYDSCLTFEKGLIFRIFKKL